MFGRVCNLTRLKIYNFVNVYLSPFWGWQSMMQLDFRHIKSKQITIPFKWFHVNVMYWWGCGACIYLFIRVELTALWKTTVYLSWFTLIMSRNCQWPLGQLATGARLLLCSCTVVLSSHNYLAKNKKQQSFVDIVVSEHISVLL